MLTVTHVFFFLDFLEISPMSFLFVVREENRKRRSDILWEPALTFNAREPSSSYILALSEEGILP